MNQPERPRWTLYVLLCVLIGSLSALVVSRLLPESVHPWVGQPFPEFQLDPLLNADQPLDASVLSGKVTLVNFWGPWCGPCQYEFPQLLKMQQQFPADRFQLLSISADGNWQSGDAKFHEQTWQLERDSAEVLARLRTDIPVYVDTDATLREKLVAMRSQGWAYPTNILVGPDGTIVDVWRGFDPNDARVRQRIEAALGEG